MYRSRRRRAKLHVSWSQCGRRGGAGPARRMRQSEMLHASGSRIAFCVRRTKCSPTARALHYARLRNCPLATRAAQSAPKCKTSRQLFAVRQLLPLWNSAGAHWMPTPVWSFRAWSRGLGWSQLSNGRSASSMGEPLAPRREPPRNR